jgi:hypothetical protein
LPLCCPATLSACGNHSGEAERSYGIGLKLFGFIPEPVFTFIPESCSGSPRNAVRNHPGIAFILPRIPQYIALLDEVFLELFFFIRTDPPANTLMLFIFCLFGCEWEGERTTPSKPGKYIVDFPAMAPWLNRHFVGLNYITEWLGLPEEETKRISLALMKPLGYEPSAQSVT